jgi:hypothetical protein
MRVVIHCDENGIERVEITHSTEAEREQAHRLYESLRAAIEKLDSAAKVAVKDQQ